MKPKILNVVRRGHRATLEEQDDTILWLTHFMRDAKADVDVLLAGNAVGAAVRGQDASGLAFGERRQTQPPQLARDVEALLGKGVGVHYVAGDARARGLEPADLVEGLTAVDTGELPALLGRYDLVLGW